MFPDFRPGQQKAYEEKHRQQREELPARLRQAELRREAQAARRGRDTLDTLDRAGMAPGGNEPSGFGLLGALRVLVLVMIAVAIVALVVVLVRGV